MIFFTFVNPLGNITPLRVTKASSFEKIRRSFGIFNIIPIQFKIKVSNSVEEGLEAHLNPIMPCPADRISPSIEGNELTEGRYA
jgi:hypothetical protein